MTADSDSTPTKTCTKCGCKRPISEFHKRSCESDGFSKFCKICKAEYVASLKAANPEFARRETERAKAWQSENIKKVAAYRARYHEENKESRNAQSRDWKARNPEKNRKITNEWRSKNHGHVIDYANKYQKARRDSCAVFDMQRRIQVLISNSIRAGGYTKIAASQKILGCDWVAFKAHIERQFFDGMSWGNRNEWHLDHIVPMATAKTEADVIALNHFTNLRPLWAKDNLSKGAQITHLI